MEIKKIGKFQSYPDAYKPFAEEVIKEIWFTKFTLLVVLICVLFAVSFAGLSKFWVIVIGTAVFFVVLDYTESCIREYNRIFLKHFKIVGVKQSGK